MTTVLRPTASYAASMCFLTLANRRSSAERPSSPSTGSSDTGFGAGSWTGPRLVGCAASREGHAAPGPCGPEPKGRPVNRPQHRSRRAPRKQRTEHWRRDRRRPPITPRSRFARLLIWLHRAPCRLRAHPAAIEPLDWTKNRHTSDDSYEPRPVRLALPASDGARPTTPPPGADP